ncbi:hypothetical protein KR009_002252 [Drosophila setifemur]|nr:hypothetical protein KR009_002252 [Drosophila setifemur]
MANFFDKLLYSKAPEGDFDGVKGFCNWMSLKMHMFVDFMGPQVVEKKRNDGPLIILLILFSMAVVGLLLYLMNRIQGFPQLYSVLSKLSRVLVSDIELEPCDDPEEVEEEIAEEAESSNTLMNDSSERSLPSEGTPTENQLVVPPLDLDATSTDTNPILKSIEEMRESQMLYMKTLKPDQKQNLNSKRPVEEKLPSQKPSSQKPDQKQNLNSKRPLEEILPTQNLPSQKPEQKQNLNSKRPLEEVLPAQKLPSQKPDQKQNLSSKRPLEEVLPAQKLPSQKPDQKQNLNSKRPLEEILPAQDAKQKLNRRPPTPPPRPKPRNVPTTNSILDDEYAALVLEDGLVLNELTLNLLGSGPVGGDERRLEQIHAGTFEPPVKVEYVLKSHRSSQTQPMVGLVIGEGKFGKYLDKAADGLLLEQPLDR